MNTIIGKPAKQTPPSTDRTTSAWGSNGHPHEDEEHHASYCSTHPGKWVRVVRDFLQTLNYGEVHLTVHKGRVIEVRKIEKTRFDEN